MAPVGVVMAATTGTCFSRVLPTLATTTSSRNVLLGGSTSASPSLPTAVGMVETTITATSCTGASVALARRVDTRARSSPSPQKPDLGTHRDGGIDAAGVSPGGARDRRNTA